MLSKNPTAVVTGAGSGVGQSVALFLAQRGWNVALIGRRADALDATIQLAGTRAGQLAAFPCDIGNAREVELIAERILSRWNPVQALVNAAGTNAPQRSLEVLSLEDYHRMIDTNLNGAYYCSQAFLPCMRAHGTGTIIHIVSDAGKQASPKAGPGYVMSKFGLAGLSQAINAEERGRGIRSCALFPGDIDTPLLNRRPVVPDSAARSKMLRPDDIAECVWLCLSLPSHAVVEEMIVRPR